MGGSGRPGRATGGGCFSVWFLCLTLMPMLMMLSGCFGAPVVNSTPNSCASLLPSEWRAPVTGIPLPGLDATVGDLWVALDGQTGKLDVANDRTQSSIGIVERCEARDAAAVKHATRSKFLGIF